MVGGVRFGPRAKDLFHGAEGGVARGEVLEQKWQPPVFDRETAPGKMKAEEGGA